MQSMMMMRAQCAPSVARPAGRAFSAVQVEAAAVSRKAKTQKRHARLRYKLSGTTDRPRLSVFRSNEHIYAQVIDDTTGNTLAAASTLSKDLREAVKETSSTCAAAEAVGKKIAELCSAKNITKVAFDRGGNVYTGRVKAVAEGARAGGLQF